MYSLCFFFPQVILIFSSAFHYLRTQIQTVCKGCEQELRAGEDLKVMLKNMMMLKMMMMLLSLMMMILMVVKMMLLLLLL